MPSFNSFQNKKETGQRNQFWDKIKTQYAWTVWSHNMDQDALLYYLANRSLSLDIWSSSHLKEIKRISPKHFTCYIHHTLKWKLLKRGKNIQQKKSQWKNITKQERQQHPTELKTHDNYLSGFWCLLYFYQTLQKKMIISRRHSWLSWSAPLLRLGIVLLLVLVLITENHINIKFTNLTIFKCTVQQS